MALFALPPVNGQQQNGALFAQAVPQQPAQPAAPANAGQSSIAPAQIPVYGVPVFQAAQAPAAPQAPAAAADKGRLATIADFFKGIWISIKNCFSSKCCSAADKPDAAAQAKIDAAVAGYANYAGDLEQYLQKNPAQAKEVFKQHTEAFQKLQKENPAAAKAVLEREELDQQITRLRNHARLVGNAGPAAPAAPQGPAVYQPGAVQ